MYPGLTLLDPSLCRWVVTGTGTHRTGEPVVFVRDEHRGKHCFRLTELRDWVPVLPRHPLGSTAEAAA